MPSLVAVACFRPGRAKDLSAHPRNSTLPVFFIHRTHPLATIKKNTRPIGQAISKINIGKIRICISSSLIDMAALV